VRIVRRRQDRVLADELAEVREMRLQRRADGQPPSMGLVNYELGLRTAGIMLGALPGWAGRRPRWWRR